MNHPIYQPCTWKNCSKQAKYNLYDNDENVWGILCPEHYIEYTDAIDSLDTMQLLRVWVLASGGAEKMI